MLPPLARLPRFAIALIAFCCLLFISIPALADSPMSKVKTGWANVPGGTVWLNPGDAYEHSTGLVRGPDGVKKYPTTPQSLQAQPSYVAPAAPPQSCCGPQYPQYAPAQPYVYPQQPYQPQPVFVPVPVPTPYPQFDSGPYMPPYQPYSPYGPMWGNRPRPSTQGWGVGSLDPMEKPKTGDAPLK